MDKLILYIACSLDGYIADATCGIGFLEETPGPVPDTGFEQFYDSVGSLIMGNTTYRQVGELADTWPYEGKPCYVYSRRETGQNGQVAFTSLSPAALLEELRSEHGGAIWLVGGGEIVQLFLAENLIDEYYIYLMPDLLGDGLPLFPAGFPKTKLSLQSVQAIGQIVEVVYHKKTK